MPNGAVYDRRTIGVFERAEAALNRLDDGRLTSADAGKMAQLMRVQVYQTRLELDHAKATHRLVAGLPELPGFVRVAPEAMPTASSAAPAPARSAALRRRR